MFAGLSLVKKLENIDLGPSNSRVIYTTEFECFAVCFYKNFYNTSLSTIEPALYTQSELVNNNLLAIGASNNFLRSNIGHIKSGGSVIWKSGFIGGVVDLYIYRAGT